MYSDMNKTHKQHTQHISQPEPRSQVNTTLFPDLTNIPLIYPCSTTKQRTGWPQTNDLVSYRVMV